MTIRPFRFLAINNNEYFVRDHRGTKICEKVFVCHECFYQKLLSYPITAFGYEINNSCEFSRDINPKFDRTDVIKALDFWIEHWVYQNKKDYILEGTVNKDFELTVRELIETREVVLKMPVDTQFVRQKIRFENKDTRSMNFMKDRYYYRFQDGHLDTNMRQTEITKYSKRLGIEFPKPLPPKQIPPDQIIEFTENVLNDSNNSASTVDQFCYVVRKMTYKEYMNRNLYHPASLIRGLFTENFRDDGQRFDFGGLETASASASEAFSDLSRTLNQIGAGMNNDEIPMRLRGGRHTDDGHRDFSITVPEGPDHILHSNLHPGIPSSTDDDFQIISVPITAQSVTITDDESDSLVFENMHLSSIDGFSFSADPNISMTVPVVFTRDNTEITINLFLTPIQQIHMFDGPLGTVHRIQITNPNDPNNWRVEIDGTEYHVVADINIRTR